MLIKENKERFFSSKTDGYVANFFFRFAKKGLYYNNPSSVNDRYSVLVRIT